MANATGFHRRYIAAALMEFWEWAEENTVDGCVDGVAPHDVCALLPEFAPNIIEAMQEVGWLEITTKGIMIPNFDRWMGCNAKKRLTKGRRQQKWRNKVVDGRVDASVDASASTIEEKRIEEKKEEKDNAREKPKTKSIPTMPESLNTPQFLTSWDAWQKHRKEKRQPLTPTAIGRQLSKLAEMGQERAIAAIEHSISMGYTGIYEPGTPKNGPSLAFGGAKEGYGPPESTKAIIERLYAEKQKRENGGQ